MTRKCLTASRCSALLFAVVVVFVSADQKIITAESGQDVILPCQVRKNNNIIVVKWNRADLGDEYVLLYQDGHSIPHHQHPPFMKRVDLQDRQMKDGNVSLILKNVTINDTGTYECHVFMNETRSWMNISFTYLNVVDPPGQPGGHTEDGEKKDGSVWLIFFLIFFTVLFGIVAVLILKKYEIQKPIALFKNYVLHGRSSVPTDDNE